MRDYKIKLIALDLDQTALRTDKSLSGRNRKALLSAIEAGIHVVIASGRSFGSLPSQVLEIPGIEYAVTSNGSAIYRLPEGERVKLVPVLGAGKAMEVLTGRDGRIEVTLPQANSYALYKYTY